MPVMLTPKIVGQNDPVCAFPLKTNAIDEIDTRRQDVTAQPGRTSSVRLSKPNLRSPRRRHNVVLSISAAVFLEAAALWLRSGQLGPHVLVRCRAGHLFTTIWLPGASMKSLRLGPWRVQRCPVGHH